MRVQPDSWPVKRPSEQVTAKVKLAPAIGTATISTATWSSDPVGLDFSNQALADSDQSAQATIGSGSDGVRYIVTVTCVLSDGQTKQPFAYLPVEEPGTHRTERY